MLILAGKDILSYTLNADCEYPFYEQEGKKVKKASLILEGGAKRGIFTSGILDYLMEKEYYIPHVIGVSAGSCNAVDYVSKQPGRTRDCMIPTDKSLNYVNGLRTFIKEKSFTNYEL